MLNIIFIGAPGCGKGTQAAVIAGKFSLQMISTGDILRLEIKNQSEIGKLAKQYIDQGQLVPNDVIINIIKNRISQDDCKNGVILDGFPRNLDQAIALDEMMQNLNFDINKVLHIEVFDDALIKRISGRYSCNECGEVYNKFFKPTTKESICDKCGSSDFLYRSDDNEKVVTQRLQVYHQQTKPIIDFYSKKGLIFSVNGLKDIPLVTSDLVEILSEAA